MKIPKMVLFDYGQTLIAEQNYVSQTKQKDIRSGFGKS